MVHHQLDDHQDHHLALEGLVKEEFLDLDLVQDQLPLARYHLGVV